MPEGPIDWPGEQALDQVTRALLEALAGAADRGAMNTEDSKRGARTLALVMLESASVAVPWGVRHQALYERETIVRAFVAEI